MAHARLSTISKYIQIHQFINTYYANDIRMHLAVALNTTIALDKYKPHYARNPLKHVKTLFFFCLQQFPRTTYNNMGTVKSQ